MVRAEYGMEFSGNCFGLMLTRQPMLEKKFYSRLILILDRES